jgi:hypothetical protein
MSNKNVLYLSDMPADGTLNPQEHNYNKLIAAYVPEELLTMGLYSTNILHDDWCQVYKHGNCNCRPDITMTNVVTGKVVFVLRWQQPKP